MVKKCTKVLVVSTDFPPLIGGTSRHTSCLCSALANNDLDIHLLTYGADLENYDANQRYTIQRISSENNYGYFNRHLKMPIKLAFAIKKKLKERPFDIVHICNGNYIPLPLRFVSIHKPVVWTIHNLPPAEMSTSLLKNPIANSILLQLLNVFFAITVKLSLVFGKYEHIISVSSFIQQKLLTKGVSSSKVTVVHNGVEKRKVEKKEKNDTWFTLLVVARVVEHKGQLEIVKALPKILQQIPNARCIIAGETVSQDYVNKIQEEMQKSSLSTNQVVLTGKVSDETINEYFSECDVYIQPSYEEGFCISIAEAMYSGLPVVGTKTGAIPDFIGENRGILLPTPNSEMIADAVISYYENPVMREEYADAGQKYIQETYDWEAIARKTIDVYQRCV